MNGSWTLAFVIAPAAVVALAYAAVRLHEYREASGRHKPRHSH